MVVPLRPLSLGAESKVPYQNRLGREARGFMGSAPMLEGDLYARIIWLHNYRTNQDVDNIAKRILDALNGIVFVDDRRVVKCLTEKIYSGAGLTLTESDQDLPAAPILDKLLSLIYRHVADVLYIEIGQVMSQQLNFGPIER